jgi:putative ABC transport system permease protein
MLVLKGIIKNYVVAGQPFPALRGVDLSFRNNEFVSILGPSGCGKTTMMNIIGGLDRYTEGDLIVDGKSTKNFTESEWDSYRNATIGFVFQTYNLISHLSVVDNVEMSLRLSGIGPVERRKRALDVLNEVGLKDHVYKRPNQLSGGQMQRVAIARALVNNPKILLADEPTGALDTQTSAQILDLIKKISKGRLVIMVTHNAELANMHSDRIVKLLDGRVVDDSRPEVVDSESSGKLMTKRTTMNFATALKTSANNLLTKKGRTIITSLAGSIGIIGIALVLSISQGMTTYVGTIQSGTLSGFPITITQTIPQFGPPDTTQPSELDYPTSTVITEYDSRPTTHTNIITDEFIDYLKLMPSQYYNAITYSRSMPMNLVAKNLSNNYRLVAVGATNPLAQSRTFYELPDNPTIVLNQYDVLAGAYPSPADKDKLVLVVDQRNRIEKDFFSRFNINATEGLSFDDLIGPNSPFNLKWIPNNVYYIPDVDNDKQPAFTIEFNPETMYQDPRSLGLQIAAILRIKPDASGEVLRPGLAYTPALTEYAYSGNTTSGVSVGATNSAVVNAQKTIWLENPAPYDVTNTANTISEAQYQTILKRLGGVQTPIGVQIYPSSFDNKEAIKAYIELYNIDSNGDRKPTEEVIIFTDLAANITSAITELINTIAVVLTAFASISLVVSSIMIGIITYVSVIERTKEIGIMRSLGARKKDIARIFNAETIIIGFVSGVFGVTITLILNIPIDIVIFNLIAVRNFTSLSPLYAFGLIFLSTFLTLLAGLIPSQIAANKDPVIALRTE